uniref:USP domain-containing protein n=1 Tax=Strongyloides venezuelensis TaxID=75913 RepID=A0A0K0FG06_STRVS
MLTKNSLLRLEDNDFYNIEEHKKFIYSKQHESAAEFLLFIFNQLQIRTPDLMKYLNYRITNVSEAPIFNININDINNNSDINSVIKGMLEYEKESVVRKCLLCNKISECMIKKRIIRKYPKYLFVELTKNVIDKGHENMGIDFTTSKDSLYVNKFFTPNTPYKLKGFITYIRFGRRTGHYVTYIRNQDKWYCLNDSQKSKKIDERKLPTKNVLFCSMKRFK